MLAKAFAAPAVVLWLSCGLGRADVIVIDEGKNSSLPNVRDIDGGTLEICEVFTFTPGVNKGSCAANGFKVSSDSVDFSPGSGISMLSESLPFKEPGDPADKTVDLPPGDWSDLEPGPENGVEKITYTPIDGQPGFINPSDTADGKARTYLIYSDTPEPASLLLLGSVTFALAGAFRKRLRNR